MKLSERLKIWFGVKSEGAFKVDDTEILKAKLKEVKEKYKGINDKYLALRGEVKTCENEIEGMKRTIDDIVRDAKICKEKGMTNEIEVLFKTKMRVENDIKNKEGIIENHNKIIEQYSSARATMLDKINELEYKLGELKAKEEFSKLTDEYIDIVGDANADESIEDLKHSIESKYNTTDLKLEEFKENNQQKDVLKSMRDKEEFEKFVDGL